LTKNCLVGQSQHLVVGAAGEAVYLGLFNTFITIFYNQVIGLSNTLIGIAIFVALLVDAIT
jgi:Na+/melibiose symporter-like transporter